VRRPRPRCGARGRGAAGESRRRPAGVLGMEWDWTLPGQRSGDDRAVRCRETGCYYHDGEACRFPWIDPPEPGELDRGLCATYLIEEDGQWLARIHAVH